MVVFPALSSPTRQILNSLKLNRRRHKEDINMPMAEGREEGVCGCVCIGEFVFGEC